MGLFLRTFRYVSVRQCQTGIPQEGQPPELPQRRTPPLRQGSTQGASGLEKDPHILTREPRSLRGFLMLYYFWQRHICLGCRSLRLGYNLSLPIFLSPSTTQYTNNLKQLRFSLRRGQNPPTRTNMDYDLPEYEDTDSQSGLYKFCAICGRDIFLMKSFYTDAGEVCGDCV